MSALAECGQNVDNYWKFLPDLGYPRGWAQAIGACRFAAKEFQKSVAVLADRLYDLYQKNRTDDWKWFEEEMTYDNGRLSMGLFWAYDISKNKKYLDVARESLDFLIDTCWDKKNDCFSFPGNKGWYSKSGLRSIYDQQPVEAGSMVESCCLAYEITKERKYADFAIKAMEWYLGRNIEKAMMYDENSGGIYDGLGDNFVNHNQGAESILSYLLAFDALQSCI